MDNVSLVLLGHPEILNQSVLFNLQLPRRNYGRDVGWEYFTGSFERVGSIRHAQVLLVLFEILRLIK